MSEVRLLLEASEAEAMKMMERLDLGDLVTYIPNKDLPRYNWFHFKEGFSRDFVLYVLELFKAREGEWVLDPFLGSGTTALACRERGLNIIGIEISPLFHLISDVKVRDYDINLLKDYSEWLFIQKYKPVDLDEIHPLLKKAFNIHNLRDIIFFRDKILEIDNIPYRNFFIVALLNAASKISLFWKEKSRLRRIKRRHIPPFRDFFKRILYKMIEDVNKLDLKPVEVHLYQSDARVMSQVGDESINYIITSPPYLNKIEYTKLYEIEYLITYGEVKVNPVRSYIGISPPGRLIRKYTDFIPTDLPPVAKAYFIDMYQVLKEMYRVLKRGGRAAIVIGEGVFPDRIIRADEILVRLASRLGFKEPEIWIVNKRVVTRARTIKIGVARESIVFLKK